MPSNADAVAKPDAPHGMDGIGSRYELHEEIGRGGMAGVYRATDHALARPVALKRLLVTAGAAERESVSALFEREYQTLIQLNHPHVIAAYDFGVLPDGSAFYTMELLDGGDLRDRAPVPWAQACRITFDICSALALLHSRHLLHRDISPRNIRCTSAGTAKLIDFGAMAPMSARASEIVGTPALIAPEALQRLSLDARTDLYSLGVTLYYALTGRLPYAARTFLELQDAWRIKPAAPSLLVSEVPAALDDLVLSLINVEAGLRPSTAFDVMQQLAACAGLRIEESEAVTRAYLSTPTLVGRDDLLGALRARSRESRERSIVGVMIRSAPGLGRSRVLDECALDAQTHGSCVLRATATGTREAFAVARALANHLLDAMPLSAARDCPEKLRDSEPPPSEVESAAARIKLRSLSELALDPARTQAALLSWLIRASRDRPLVIAVDDVHKIDQPSAALLAELLDNRKQRGILVALAADDAQQEELALQALMRRCSVLPLAPLTREQTRRLLDSLFGDVPHLDMLSDEIQRVALGNPRHTLDMAEHLVERGTIRYAAGNWILPAALSRDDLPRSAAAGLHARLGRLSAAARRLAEAQALAFFDTFSDADYRLLLPEVSALEAERAISELLEAQVIVRDGALYLLANRGWTQALVEALDAERTVQTQRALAALCEAKQHFGFIHHAFAAGMDQEALKILDLRNDVVRSEADYKSLYDQNVGKLLWTYPRAIVAALARGDSARQIFDLRRWQYLCCLMTDDAPDADSARLWCERIALDSGLTAYRADTTTADPGQRLMSALQSAYARYQATPEHERVYPVDEAIRKLGEYVVISIPLAVRTMDNALLRGLPEMLEPFVSLSPLLQAIWNNAVATRQSQCHCEYERARAGWIATLEKLDAMTESTEMFLDGMRNAIAAGIGAMEAQLGVASAARWAERLERDPLQRISALNLRKVVRLEQGDASGADRLRRQAEVLSLQLRAPQMFKFTLLLEMQAYFHSRDLSGLTWVIEQLRPIAARHPAWRPHLEAASACFHAVRGDWETAMAHFERCTHASEPDASGESANLGMWITSQGGLSECLLGLGRHAEARAIAARALQFCEGRQLVSASFELVRRLALAEAKLGDPQAAERMDALIATQNELGCTGLRMGLSYEARARIAIGVGDAAAFERFAELTAKEYRHGARTSLAARYERLMNEAARRGMHAKLSMVEFEALAGVGTSGLGSRELTTVISRSLASHRSTDERARAALDMICAAHASAAGHLFLITSSGPVHVASRVESSPSTSLLAKVRSYVEWKCQRAKDMHDMLTGALDEDEAGTLVLSVQSAAANYELLPLGCMESGRNLLVGIAVIEGSDTRTRNERQQQLLNAIATSLLQHGDTQGVGLGADD